jgi:hypothetical protein
MGRALTQTGWGHRDKDLYTHTPESEPQGKRGRRHRDKDLYTDTPESGPREREVGSPRSGTHLVHAAPGERAGEGA